ncbi:MAG TPA: ribonuclease HII [Candidatus Limnocylindria bacterium]|nr:ribonuclease HII [Candidatus Limnocylindria bacterium]
MPAKFTDRFQHERELFARGLTRLAGVDEAGRGPLAGPVVAAAVVFPGAWFSDGFPAGLGELNDSKQLTEAQRERFFDALTNDGRIQFAIAQVGAEVIDRINILEATHRAMNEALRGVQPQHALVDGLPVKSLQFPQTPLVKGDARSYSIAAASVLAKVTRDRLMVAANLRWPGYGFAQHKGYGTPEHLAVLASLGPCPLHRRSFAPLKRPEPELFPA